MPRATRTSPEPLARRLDALLQQREDPRGLASAVGGLLARETGADSHCFLLLDPGSGLPVQVVGEGHPPESGQVVMEKAFLRSPGADWGRRALEPRRVYRLEELLTGPPAEDPYVRELGLAHGFGDEVQVSFAAEGLGYGHLCLSRLLGRPAFGPAELRLLRAWVAPITAALQQALAGSTRESPPGGGVGLVLFQEDGRLEAANALGEQLLRGFLQRRHNRSTLALGAMTQLLQHTREAPPELHFVDPERRERFRVRAERLHGADGRVRGMLLIEPARALDSEAALRQLGLTAREAEVALATVRGLKGAEGAQALRMSPHTFSTHLRHVFAKLDVQSRPELAARLLGGT